MPTLFETSHPVTSGRLTTADGRTFPLLATRLEVTAAGGLARTRLVQRFANPHAEPLSVTYQLPLPADGAVAAFAFAIGERRVEGEIEGRRKARERYEEALLEGRSAGLLEQDRTALFQQAIGNIPPGAEIEAELTIDQPLAWIDGGQWEYRFPTTVAPRYLGEPGATPDAERISVDVADGATPARLELCARIGDTLAGGSAPSSPSHALRIEGAQVRLASDAGVRLDRDVVLRWQVGTMEVGAELERARPGAAAPHANSAYGLLTLVPPAAPSEFVARDLTVLLDTSGSMGGAPLEQAKSVVDRLIAGLTDRDQLQMIEFSDAPRRWKSKPVRATAAEREQARAWLMQLSAGGSTEMLGAVEESLRSLRDDAQCQVLLVTDGLIGFEGRVASKLMDQLPRNCRFHVLGVGSAANRSLTNGAARAGRGVEVLVGLEESPETAARRLEARLRAPVVVNLELSGSALIEVAPERSPDLFAGEPARLSLRLRPEGGELLVRGSTAEGPFVRRLVVAATVHEHGRPEVVTRFGRERVEDLEMLGFAGQRNDATIESLGLQFGLATRLTSWIAISSEKTVDPSAPIRRERIAHELPHGMSAEGLGLRHALSMPMSAGTLAFDRMCAPRLVGFPEEEFLGQAQCRFAVAIVRECRRGTLVLEFDWLCGEWELPARVAFRWLGGRVVKVRVDAKSSTRSGSIAAGALVRLVLRWADAGSSDLPDSVDWPGGSLTLQLESR